MSRTIRTCCAWLCIIVAPSAFPSTAAHAQTVRGTLLESLSKVPIPLGSIALIDTVGRIIDQTVTNERGHFELRSPQPGSFYVAAEKIGYRRAVDGIIDLPRGASISAEFYMRAQAFVLDSIKVVGERRPTEIFMANQGFYERQKMGFGYFITPEELQKRPPMTYQQLFQRVALQVRVSAGQMGTVLQLKGTGRTCNPTIYIDGVRMASSGPVVLENVINVYDIAGVEVYNRASNVPLEYGGVSGGCVVLMWTWHGVASRR